MVQWLRLCAPNAGGIGSFCRVCLRPENKTKITLISSPLHPSLLNVLKEEIQFVLLAMRLSLSQALQRAWHMMGGSWQVHGI